MNTTELKADPGFVLPSAHQIELPCYFEEHRGQTSAPAKFLVRGKGFSLLLEPDGAVFSLRRGTQTPALLHLRLLGASGRASLHGEAALPGRSHYLLGKDPAGWRTDVRHYARVRAASIYPGTDALFYERDALLAIDFVLAPGADPKRIRLRLEHADRVTLEESGAALVRIAGADLRLRTPRVYQEVEGGRREIHGAFVLRAENELGFALGAYDQNRPLIIDPTIEYSTYLGGGSDDEGRAIRVDAAGHLLVAGVTSSANFPLAGALQSGNGGLMDVFVAKLDPSNGTLVFATYLGGSGDDSANDIGLDSTGNIYLAGGTSSANFPTTAGAFRSTPAGGRDAFVAKLNPTGSALLYSTYLGGASGGESASSIAIDSSGNAYVAGNTNSFDFPVVTPIQSGLGTGGGNSCLPGPCPDVFVSKLTAAGTALVYSTYLGGGGTDSASAIVVDSAGRAYLTGETGSSGFPTVQPIQSGLAGGFDSFIARLNTTGTALEYSTFLGGSGFEQGFGLAVDAAGNVYAVGKTDSGNFPTVAALQSRPAGQRNAVGTFPDEAYLTKVSSAGSAFVFSTYLGGQDRDLAWGVAVDSSGSAYLAGQTVSNDFPTRDTMQAYFGRQDAFVAKVDPSGAALLYSTFLGGSEEDQGRAITIDSVGRVYIVGFTSSPDFPTVGAFQGMLAALKDAFVARIVDTNPPLPPVNADLVVTNVPDRATINRGETVRYSILVRNGGPAAAGNVVITDPLPPEVNPTSAMASFASCTGSRTIVCNLGTLAPGSSATLTVDARHDGTSTGPFSNTVRAQSTTPDPGLSNNSATATVFAEIPGVFVIGPPGAGCFIATAAFGSPWHGELALLRRFRDERLQSNAAGRAFVRYYYRVSPPVAEVIAQSDVLRAITRAVLAPAVSVAEQLLPAKPKALPSGQEASPVP